MIAYIRSSLLAREDGREEDGDVVADSLLTVISTGTRLRCRLLVSPRLREDFHNGDQFYARAGQAIDLPKHRIDRPNREFLEWHLDEVFKVS